MILLQERVLCASCIIAKVVLVPGGFQFPS